MRKNQYVRRFEELSSKDVSLVGGKNASLGEMISSLKKEGIIVPEGFATTASAYKEFLKPNNLKEKIEEALKKLKPNNSNLAQIGSTVRKLRRQAILKLLIFL